MKTYIDLPQDILDIANAYFKAGAELYVVGGFVRDFVKYGDTKKSHDIDLVTNCQADKSKEILKDFRVSDEQGANFSVIRVYTKNFKEGIEIATFRKDIVKNGRDTKGSDKKVETGEHITIEDDVLRRDLTCNALFYNIKTQEIIDLVGGIDDIKNNVFKCVGISEHRFEEDSLRKLRTLRFCSRNYGKIDIETSKALKENNSLKTVSRERIFEEFIDKMLAYAKEHNDLKMMQNYLDLLSEYDMWDEMFPKMSITKIVDLKSFEPAVIFAQLFETNNTDNRVFLKYLVSELKFTDKLANEVNFLINFKNMIVDDTNSYFLIVEAKRHHITEELITEYVNSVSVDVVKVDKFLKYLKLGITTKGDDLEKEGFIGKSLGAEKIRRELEIYKSL